MLRLLPRAASLRAPWVIATRHLALPPHTVVGMPALSPTMTQGNVAKYIASVGDELTVGDRLAEIETDKATVDFEMADDGVVAKFLLPEGATDIEVGTPMVILVDDAASVPAFADYVVEAPAPAAAAPAAAAPTPAPVAAAVVPPPVASPAAAAAPSIAGVGLPPVGGRIYYNAEKGWYRS